MSLYDDLAATHHSAFPSARVWSSAEIEALLSDPAITLVGDPEAFVIGRIVAGEAEIITLVTHPDHQRQGRAAQLLSQFEDTAKSKEAKACFLEVAQDNGAAKALYQKRGYRESGRRTGYYRRKDGTRIDAVLFQKDLSAS